MSKCLEGIWYRTGSLHPLCMSQHSIGCTLWPLLHHWTPLREGMANIVKPPWCSCNCLQDMQHTPRMMHLMRIFQVHMGCI